jgi:hypothetical protein
MNKLCCTGAAVHACAPTARRRTTIIEQRCPCEIPPARRVTWGACRRGSAITGLVWFPQLEVEALKTDGLYLCRPLPPNPPMRRQWMLSQCTMLYALSSTGRRQMTLHGRRMHLSFFALASRVLSKLSCPSPRRRQPRRQQMHRIQTPSPGRNTRQMGKMKLDLGPNSPCESPASMEQRSLW